MADDTKVCPWCAESIKAAAVVCRYCGRHLPAGSPMESEELRGLRAQYGPILDAALQQEAMLQTAPLNRVAWLSEFCKRVTAGSPAEAAAKNIPTDWSADEGTPASGQPRPSDERRAKRKWPWVTGAVFGFLMWNSANYMDKPTRSARMMGDWFLVIAIVCVLVLIVRSWRESRANRNDDPA